MKLWSVFYREWFDLIVKGFWRVVLGRGWKKVRLDRDLRINILGVRAV